MSKDRIIIETMRNREEEQVAKSESGIRELQEEICMEKKVSNQRGLSMELMRVEYEQSISLLKKNHEEIYLKRSAELEEKTLESDAARNSISLLNKQLERQRVLLQENKKTIDGFREIRNDLIGRLKNKEEAIKNQEEELVEENKKRVIVTNKYSFAKVKIQELEEAIASKNELASKTSDNLVDDLRREIALKNRELVEKTNEEIRAREKIEKLVNDKERLNKKSEEVSKEKEELEATVKSLERQKLMDSDTLQQQKKTINDLQKYQQQTEVEEESDELDYSSQMDRSRMSQAGQLPQPSQSTLSEAALRKHNAENQLFSTPIQTPGRDYGIRVDDEDDDDHARQALFRTSRLRTVIGKDEDKASSSTANQTTSDPASSLSSKSSPESRTSDKENEFKYSSRGDFKSRRNELQPPHLRSSYPVEQDSTDSTPSKGNKLNRNAFKKPKRRSSMMEFGNTIRKRFKRIDKTD